MFHYSNNRLFCDGVPLADIAAQVGSPTYIYSAELIRKNTNSYLLADSTATFAYALKANQNLAILKLLCTTGIGADVTSGGELFLALEAGFDPKKIIFSGVGKRDDEIRMALKADISAIHVESTAELYVIESIAAEMGKVARVGFRLNPNVSADTHPYISTGLLENKFGVPMAEGMALIQHAAASVHLHPTGIAFHIGSQIKETASFVEAAHIITDLAIELRSAGIELDYIDIGGGLGIDYAQGISDTNLQLGKTIQAWVKETGAPIKSAGFGLKAEPGRSIIGGAGCLLTQVTFTKNNGEKQFAIVDSGMNDLIRPTLYQADHPILPLNEANSGEAQMIDVVGPICESGDFMAKNRVLPRVQRGDLLAIMNAGAYGFAMSSNYNGRLKPAEVLVEGAKWEIIRPRQQLKELL
ncbi:MAG: diaminopimelate decarboxylase [Anaerolineae bacterium]